MQPKFYITFISQLFFCQTIFGQVFSFTTRENGQEIQHRILMDDDYYVETQFTTKPNQFIKTIGGFYHKKGNDLLVALEFNSNFSNDRIKHIVVVDQDRWKEISKANLPLQGRWLMAGRVIGNKERRRDTNRPRKTMKILIEGFFQWIAYNTESFSFHGTGGGSYTATDSTYMETIDYFSRDNSKVGISLEFEYAKKNMDWHHQGFSSKGDPLHEIWTYRIP